MSHQSSQKNGILLQNYSKNQICNGYMIWDYLKKKKNPIEMAHTHTHTPAHTHARTHSTSLPLWNCAAEVLYKFKSLIEHGIRDLMALTLEFLKRRLDGRSSKHCANTWLSSFKICLAFFRARVCISFRSVLIDFVIHGLLLGSTLIVFVGIIMSSQNLIWPQKTSVASFTSVH